MQVYSFVITTGCLIHMAINARLASDVFLLTIILAPVTYIIVRAAVGPPNEVGWPWHRDVILMALLDVVIFFTARGNDIALRAMFQRLREQDVLVEARSAELENLASMDDAFDEIVIKLWIDVTDHACMAPDHATCSTKCNLW